MPDDAFEADERIVRVRFLHEPHDAGQLGLVCPECSDPEGGMSVMWPCRTVRTLDGERFWFNTPDSLSPLAGGEG